MAGVTLREMEEVALNFDTSDLGNVMNMGGDDSLGLGMLANPMKTVTVNAPEQSSGGWGSSGSSNGMSEIEVTNLPSDETPITLNFGGGGGGGGPSQSAPIDIEFKRADDDKNFFSNNQTATGPTISLAPVGSQRDPMEEKKEKIEYLNKLQRLEQKGFQVSRRFTMDNGLDEIKQEYMRLVDAKQLETSLRFQRQALIGVVTGMEWLNGRFDPFDIKLDGWSESVHENVEDFDEIFEELYDKYKERGKMPPEARLMMALAGSGFMCHVSNTFLKSRLASVSTDDILKNNPDLARQFASAAAQQAGPGFGSFMNMAMGGAGGAGPAQQAAPVGGGAGAFFGSSAQAAAQAAGEAQARARAEVEFRANQAAGGLAPQAVASMEQPKQTMRREMRGPSGVDDILRSFDEARRNESMEGTAFPQVPVTPQQQPATAAAIEIQSLGSGDDIGSMADSTKSGRRRRRAPVLGSTLSFNV